MEAPMAGIVTIAFVLLLSRKLGWDAGPARIPILLATVLFACALLFPTIAAVEKDTGWLIAGHSGTALGGILLVIAVLQLEPKGPPKSDRQKKSKRKRKSGKIASLPPAEERAGELDAPARPPQETPPPDPADPYTGPHGDKA